MPRKRGEGKMEEELLLSYSIVKIDDTYYCVVFPMPKEEEIKSKSFSYPVFRDTMIDYLSQFSHEDRLNIINTWANPKEQEGYAPAIARVQIAYEEDLRKRKANELDDIYTEKMKQIINNYYNYGLAKTDKEVEEYYQAQKEKIEKTSSERLKQYDNGELLFGDLYMCDLKGFNFPREKRDIKRFYCASIDMETVIELGPRIHVMTTREIYEYNAERKVRKESRNRGKTRTKTNNTP